MNTLNIVYLGKGCKVRAMQTVHMRGNPVSCFLLDEDEHSDHILKKMRKKKLEDASNPKRPFYKGVRGLGSK